MVSGKRKVVIITTAAHFHRIHGESIDAGFIRTCVAKGSNLNADEADLCDNLHVPLWCRATPIPDSSAQAQIGHTRAPIGKGHVVRFGTVGKLRI